MTDQDKLLPCPFCGCARPPETDGEMRCYWLRCVECSMESPTGIDIGEAEIKWNTRTTDARIAKLEEALRWYIKHDEVDETDKENQYYIDGKQRARAALENK